MAVPFASVKNINPPHEELGEGGQKSFFTTFTIIISKNQPAVKRYSGRR